jgi:hypothetical protein
MWTLDGREMDDVLPEEKSADVDALGKDLVEHVQLRLRV